MDDAMSTVSVGTRGARGASPSVKGNPVYRVQDRQDEIMQLQMALARNAVSGAGGGARLVSGSQFRAGNTGPRGCEMCENMHDKVKRGREALRINKLQLGRAEERIRELERTKEAADRLQSKLLHGDASALEDKTNALNEKLRLKTQECINANKKYRDECDAHTILQGLHTEMTSRAHTAEEQRGALQLEVQRLRDALGAAEAALDSRKKALETQRQRFEALLREARSDAASSEAREAEFAALREQLTQAQTFARDLEQKALAQERAASREAGELLARAEEAEAALREAQHAVDAKDHEVMVQSSARNNAECCVSDLEQQLAALRASSAAESSKAAGDWETERARLMTENARLKAQNDDILFRLKRDSENTAKALEKAIGASVRLCVVAPTVNVVVQDKKIKVESAVDRTAMQNEIQEKVLQPYSQIFKQERDDAAPDGSDLGAFIQDMLSKMQASIQEHIIKSLRNRPDKS